MTFSSWSSGSPGIGVSRKSASARRGRQRRPLQEQAEYLRRRSRADAELRLARPPHGCDREKHRVQGHAVDEDIVCEEGVRAFRARRGKREEAKLRVEYPVRRGK